MHGLGEPAVGDFAYGASEPAERAGQPGVMFPDTGARNETAGLGINQEADYIDCRECQEQPSRPSFAADSFIGKDYWLVFA